MFSGQDDLQEVLKRGAWLRFAAGALIAIPGFSLFYNNTDFTGNVGIAGMLAEDGQLRIVGLFAVGLVCWLMLFGIWGLLVRYVRSESRVLRYLADASFWIYLVHIPFLVAIQSSLAETHLEVALRYALTVMARLPWRSGATPWCRERRRLWVRLTGQRHPRRVRGVAYSHLRRRTSIDAATVGILGSTLAVSLGLAAPAGRKACPDAAERLRHRSCC